MVWMLSFCFMMEISHFTPLHKTFSFVTSVFMEKFNKHQKK